jgi:acyl-CoA thioesterase FadM
MPRIELTFPGPAIFTTTLPIRIDDLNYGGHLGNDRVLALAQEARVRWLASLGFASELDVAGAALIMADAAVVYRGEGRQGMSLAAELALDDVRTRSFDLHCRLADAASGKEIALVKAGLLWFDYQAGKVIRAPEAWLRAVGKG